MNSAIDLEKCHVFINCHLHPHERARLEEETGRRYDSVTISRQTGSGGHLVGEKLAELLQAEEEQVARPWTVFDRNLVERVLEDHNLPGRLARFMPEDHISEITDTMDELFGLHPPSWVLVRQTSETILRLAQLGHVIVIGRGANIITRKLPHVFHVRLVGSLEKRVQRLQEVKSLGAKEALRLADREDLARRRYLKQFFDKNIDDPLLYHLVINTDLISLDETAEMIAGALKSKALTPA